MHQLLSDLGVGLPIIAAPMAGGPSTPALVVAAARAGGLGFLAGGYKTAEALAGQIRDVGAEGVAFGVNVFVPNPVPVSARAYRRYAREVQVEADRYGLTLPEQPVEDDDHWSDKIDLLISSPVPWVSFTFGIPERGVIAALRRAGSVVFQSVTTADEARQAAASGVDALIVQAAAGGGHSATLTPAQSPAGSVSLRDLIAQVNRAVDLPLIATGGIATAADVAASLDAGAPAAMVGTVLLRTNESGASVTAQGGARRPGFRHHRHHPRLHRPPRTRPAQPLHRPLRPPRPRRLPRPAPPHKPAPQSRHRSRRQPADPPVGRNRLPQRRGRASC